MKLVKKGSFSDKAEGCVMCDKFAKGSETSPRANESTHDTGSDLGCPRISGCDRKTPI